MGETQQNSRTDLVRQARERLTQEFRVQAEQLQKLEQALKELRGRQQQFESAVTQQLEVLEKAGIPSPLGGPDAALDKVLGAVGNLITSTLPEQVLDVLTEEAVQMGVRAAVFDVRGKAAWGSSARGFGPQLSDKSFRAVVVPLNQDNPFRQVYETGGHLDANAELLKKNRNVLDKLKPSPGDPILLLPIRSAGAVSAIFYADVGGKGGALPADALKILAEFAGAQLDRLMALSGGVPTPAVEREAEVAEPVAEAEEPLSALEPVESKVAGAAAAPAVESFPAAGPPSAVVSSSSVAFDVTELSEADQKIHKDAKRFAKLLVSEIELYNKAKVADGRKSKDLYKRLKADIDRSRHTFEKRFGKTVGTQIDYFHEELVRTLAGNDSSLLGEEYPGPSV